ncbi:class I SAM-dependent DNA methyltransferase [Streptomyces sp. NRRL S-481]|uniref:class I SAM-dependent DNA methyltransferase n=1 Tax=Streptomyces sp. NRRL S-481 TaxID=1463911 RepID=UPI0004CB61DC|nr:class I SAM-dependent methyltransferase [Streptomyces sp. NRRL S-481]
MTEPSHVTAVRESYDTVAADYARVVKEPTELDPVSRAMLAAFAELVRSSGAGPVADLGCGPGKVTAHLAALGVPVFGVDVSPKMIELARAAYPQLRFAVGSMTALEIGSGELGGVLAYYVTHHTPPEWLPTVFAEFHRALAPGGVLMLAGHVGNGEHLRPTHAYESYLLPPDRIAELLHRAGLVVMTRVVQEPEDGAKRQYGTFLASKPR